MDGELEKAQARSRKLFDDARRVAILLGSGDLDVAQPQTGGIRTRMSFHAGSGGGELHVLFIECSAEPNSTVEVWWCGEAVFQQRGPTVENYIPGVWETVLESLQVNANRMEEESAKSAEAKKRIRSERDARQRQSWGLTDTDCRNRQGDDPPIGPRGTPLGRSPI